MVGLGEMGHRGIDSRSADSELNFADLANVRSLRTPDIGRRRQCQRRHEGDQQQDEVGAARGHFLDQASRAPTLWGAPGRTDATLNGCLMYLIVHENVGSDSVLRRLRGHASQKLGLPFS